MHGRIGIPIVKLEILRGFYTYSSIKFVTTIGPFMQSCKCNDQPPALSICARIHGCMSGLITQ